MVSGRDERLSDLSLLLDLEDDVLPPPPRSDRFSLSRPRPVVVPVAEDELGG